MKKLIAILVLTFTFPLLFAGCTGNGKSNKTAKETSSETSNETSNEASANITDATLQETEKITYAQIDGADAFALMQSESNYIIIDARTEEEFAQGHIKDAILIPEYEINEKAPSLLQNKDQLILVYCRSGRRSKIAADALVALGYTNVKEFGGIIDWEYETVT